MLRPSRALWLIGPTILLGGCPIYPSGCETDEDCDYAYVCDYPSQQCVPYDQSTPGPERCHSSSDCDPGLVCDAYDRCTPPGAGGASSGEGGATAAGSAGEAGAGAAGAAG